ncbi:MAG: DNA-protecting protein DprA [Jatrophihabitans sp.]|nr:MAG: DNA-protecting protein DprA [Jatrophihabitans sp.]
MLLARAYLSRVGEPASIPLWGYVRAHGPVVAWRRIRDGTAPADVLAVTSVRRASADPAADLEAAQRCGLRLVVPESAEWPHFAFAAIERTGAARLARFGEPGGRTHSPSGELVPPLALWVRGGADLTSMAVHTVGVVGARAATAYGEHVTAELAYAAASAGLTVVSGGAYGIDAAAHRAALAAGGETVIVSAGGLDRPYPGGNAALFERAADRGLLVSESPPGCAPQRRRFLTRNRLIASFATGTVVVEAARRSGALNTAGHCRGLGRPLMVVPGPVTSAMSVGCHDLLRDEERPAHLVTGAADVLALVGGLDTPVPDAGPPVHGGRRDDRADLVDALDPIQRQVLDGLPAVRFATPDEIALRSAVSPREVIRALPALDLAGLLEASDGGYRVARRMRRTAR